LFPRGNRPRAQPRQAAGTRGDGRPSEGGNKGKLPDMSDGVFIPLVQFRIF